MTDLINSQSCYMEECPLAAAVIFVTSDIDCQCLLIEYLAIVRQYRNVNIKSTWGMKASENPCIPSYSCSLTPSKGHSAVSCHVPGMFEGNELSPIGHERSEEWRRENRKRFHSGRCHYTLRSPRGSEIFTSRCLTDLLIRKQVYSVHSEVIVIYGCRFVLASPA